MLRIVHVGSGLVRLVLAAALGAVVLALVAMGGLVWRLNEGPLDVTGLARHVLPLVDPRITVSHLSLALARVQGERVLRLELHDGVRVSEAEQPADSVRTATLALALSPLLVGRVLPEEVSASGIRLHLRRAISAKPGAPGGDPSVLLSRLRGASLSDVEIVVADGALGQSWRVSDVALDLQRQPDGSLRGQGAATASVGDVSVTAQATGTYSAAASQIRLALSPVSPATIGRAVPPLAPLQMLDAPVGLTIDASFGPGFAPLQAAVHATAGPGTAQLPAQGGGTSPAKFQSMALDMTASPTHAAVQSLQIVLPSPSGAPPSTLVLSGTADRAAGRFTAKLAIDLDHAAFADLPSFWPEHVGGNARQWLTENLTAGTAHDGHASFTLAGTEAGDDLNLTEASGTLTGEDVTAWWLRPVSPLEHGHAVVSWQSPDTLFITVSAARQGALAVAGGSVRITGLTDRDQMGLINADIGGPLSDLLTLLRTPRLQLLSKHPIAITAPSGAFTAHLTVQLPLDARVTVDQVAIHANGQTTGAHFGAIAAGRDLDRGQLTFDVTNDGLSIAGTAQLDHVPGTLAVDMDFRTGPPSQVLQHAAVTLRVGKRDAQEAGLGAIGLDAGTMLTKLDYAERRDGGATLSLHADLREAGFQTPLGWSKPVGAPGSFEGQALLTNGRLVGLEGLRAEAPGLSINARSDLAGGVPAVIHLDRGVIGRTSATGTVSLPQHEGDPYRVSLSGSRLDLEGRLNPSDAVAPAPRETAPSGHGTPYAIDLHFQQVTFAAGRSIGPLTLTANGDGKRLQAARLVTGGPEHVQADLVPDGNQRKLWATADDLGLLLHNTNLAGELAGGTLILDGSFDDRLPNSPFNGTIDLRNFRVQGAPAMGKLLQGMTLYGLVDALSGPGLVFDHFASPFRLDGAVLDVVDARAYSSSLGVTATGRLDFARKQVDLKGTIVPAYFFNSLPGRVPLLGRLFSPEKGSGLFAATYALTGSLLDPGVTVNPLSALTPGFTRRLFELFE